MSDNASRAVYQLSGCGHVPEPPWPLLTGGDYLPAYVVRVKVNEGCRAGRSPCAFPGTGGSLERELTVPSPQDTTGARRGQRVPSCFPPRAQLGRRQPEPGRRSRWETEVRPPGARPECLQSPGERGVTRGRLGNGPVGGGPSGLVRRCASLPPLSVTPSGLSPPSSRENTAAGQNPLWQEVISCHLCLCQCHRAESLECPPV